MSSAALNRVQDNFAKPVSPSRITTQVPVLAKRSGPQPSSPEPSEPAKSWKTWSAAVLVVLATAGSIGAYKATSAETAATEAAAAAESAATPKTVKVAQPTQVASVSVVLPATIRPWQSTTLHARVSGYLTVWHSDLGAKVEAGELLAEIETPELDQELAEGEALAQEAAAAGVQAKAEYVEAQADLRVARAQLLRAQADAQLSKSQLVRRERLLATRAVSQEEYDTFQKQTEARLAEVTAAEADVSRRRTSLETRTSIIAARQATANSRRSNVDRLQELQVFKRIVAPFAGVVTKRSAEVGMLVSAGKESLFVVEDMSRVRVQVDVPQTYSVQTVPGATAIVSVPESSASAVTGKITRVADSVDSTNRTMLAEIELENSNHRFQPGSYAQVTLTTQQADSVWTIPINTVQMRVEGPHVALVNAQNQIEIKRVILGRDLGVHVVVLDGIHGDERLVVNPGDDLHNGQSIQVSESGNQLHKVAQR